MNLTQKRYTLSRLETLKGIKAHKCRLEAVAIVDAYNAKGREPKYRFTREVVARLVKAGKLKAVAGGYQTEPTREISYNSNGELSLSLVGPAVPEDLSNRAYGPPLWDNGRYVGFSYNPVLGDAWKDWSRLYKAVGEYRAALAKVEAVEAEYTRLCDVVMLGDEAAALEAIAGFEAWEV